MSELLQFEVLGNVRDLGGMHTKDGRRVRSGKLIRSEYLHAISQGDCEKLSGLIGTVVDFRTEEERKEKPDTRIPGVEYLHVPVVASFTAGISREKEANQDMMFRFMDDPAGAKEYMSGMYRYFTESTFAMEGYERFVRLLLEGSDKAFLWHCSAGKDRAGIAAVIVEELLGVVREEIISDYMKTNDYLRKKLPGLMAEVKRQGGKDGAVVDDALWYFFGADEYYIRSFYDAAEKNFGDFEGYLRRGLHITEEEQESLRKRYLQ